MDAVLDANVLFRILISGGQILKLVFDERLKLFAPEKLKEEFLNNKKEILSKSKLSAIEFDELCSLMFKRITLVSLEKYKEFLPKAKQLLGKHEKDEDFVALCLLKDIKLWTYEIFLFNIGFGISTKEVSDKLLEETE